MSTESRKLSVLKEIAAVLDGPGKPEGVTVHRQRDRPIWVDNLPAMVVYPAPNPNGVEEEVSWARMSQRMGGQLGRTLNFRVELRAEVPDDEPATDVLDEMYVWAVKALHGSDRLNGLVVAGPREQRSASQSETDGERTIARMAIEFEAEYRTRVLDPTEA